MRVYVASDFHIHDTDNPWLFTQAKARIFAAVAKEVSDAGGALLLAGDIFDLTGMQPPELGLTEFFANAAPGKTVRSIPARPLAVRLQAALDRLPDFRDALRPLAETGRLWLMAGNHDCGLDSEAARAVLGTAIGVDPQRFRFEQSYRVEDVLLTAHGHEFDSSNGTANGCTNAGSIVTSCLYHAVQPALAALGAAPEVVAAIPCVRPEENIVTGLQGYLGDHTSAFLRAFVKLLQDNGYFHGLTDIRIWLAMHFLRGLVTSDRVRDALRDDSDIALKSREAASRLLSGRGLVKGGEPAPSLVVLGHTHELDALPDYVNLGTWVDHVRGLAPADLAAVERALPVLLIDGANVTLHDVREIETVGSVAACHRLWARGEPAITLE
jgi:UDP-2,3-diacylglucosamine pyrophosphatase LpxH